MKKTSKNINIYGKQIKQGMYILLNAYVRKQKQYKMNDLSFQHKILKMKKNIYPKKIEISNKGKRGSQ